MHEFNDEIFVDEKDDKSDHPGHSTGPRSPHGKARSSMNRLTHGCRSEQLVIPGEDPAEFEFTVESWTKSYNPEDPTAATLVFEAAKAHWFFQRNQKRLGDIEVRLPYDTWQWTDRNHHLFSTALRYKTAAERSFYRAFNTLEAYYKRQSDRAAQAEKARAEMAKIQIKWLNNKAFAAAQSTKLTQIVDVVPNERGDCVTTYAPTNEQLACLADSENPPRYVSRFLHFTYGVPPAYEWLNPNPIQRTKQSIGLQLFTFADWLKQVEAEKACPAGHLIPRAAALLPDDSEP